MHRRSFKKNFVIMLSIANIDVLNTLSVFKKYGVRVSFIVPTSTGLKKSIMDATEDIRLFLKDAGIHNYINQSKGKENKIIKDCKLITGNNSIETKVSLYRPETKDGDPRIWIYELKKYAVAGDLLALVTNKKKLLIVNCSNTEIKNHFDKKISDLFYTKNNNLSSTANELIEKLNEISKKGYIKNLKSGDTGIGFTLETLLGINQNSSQKPDYFGIEIKSLRKRSKKGTLFSQVPDWKISTISSANDLVMKRGKKNPDYGNLITLRHSINAIKENSYNLKLLVEEGIVHQIYSKKDIVKDVCWNVDVLKNRINEKHNETFWIDAVSKGEGSDEMFHFEKIIHTGQPDLDVIPLLINQGSISVDYLLWEKRHDWKKYITKKGFDFLWKIRLKDRDLLFKTVKEHILN